MNLLHTLNIPANTTKHRKQTWINVSLIYFMGVAVLGVLMRLMNITEIPALVYDHLLHAHSHLAFLGWVYMALIISHFFRSTLDQQ